MINGYVTALAEQMGIKLSCVSICNNIAFSNSNRKNLKIASGGKLVFVPFKSEELMDGVISEKLKNRLCIVLTNIAELT